jgi:CRP-like cAMP-binding protein
MIRPLAKREERELINMRNRVLKTFKKAKRPLTLEQLGSRLGGLSRDEIFDRLQELIRSGEIIWAGRPHGQDSAFRIAEKGANGK